MICLSWSHPIGTNNYPKTENHVFSRDPDQRNIPIFDLNDSLKNTVLGH